MINITEKDKLTREKEVERSEENYDAVYDVMTTLIGDYAANETAIKRGNAVTLIAFGGAAVSACVAVISGGSLAPAAYAAFVGAYNSSQTAQRHPKSAEYLAAMEMTMTALDNAMYDMNAAYHGGFLSVYGANGVVVDYQLTIGYAAQYKAYMKKAADHGLIRLTAPNSVLDADGLNTSVNVQSKDSGYYHEGATSHSDFDHGFLKELLYKHYDGSESVPLLTSYTWDTHALPHDKPCKGPCDVMFRSPHEASTAHIEVCGEDHYLVGHSLDGCGRTYYNCPGGLNVPFEHDVLPCTRYNEVRKNGENVKEYCGVLHRFCTTLYWSEETLYTSVTPSGRCAKRFPRMSVTVDSHLYVESQADEEANAGETTPTPTMHACGIHDASVSGDHSSGTYTCSVHSGSLCQQSSDHQTTITGYSGAFYECIPHTTGLCGHTYKILNASVHVKVQCPDTNAQGRCSYTYWGCSNQQGAPAHTHAFPAAPAPVFSPSVSLNSQSYSAGGSVSISITSAAPIYGAHLYVRVPGDTSRYGTQIGWFRGNNDRTTTTLPLSYTFPDDAALGTYQIALRVYPWNGNTYGDPSDLFESVTIE